MNSNFVSTAWLKEHLNNPSIQIIDATMETVIKNLSISGEEAYKIGHIPNAIHVNIQDDFSDDKSNYLFTYPSEEYMLMNLARLGIRNETKIVIYDQSASYESIWASRLWWQLKSLGLRDIVVLEGGYRKWIEENREISKELIKYPQVSKMEILPNKRVVTKKDVLVAVQEKSSCLVHSLSLESYLGYTNNFGRRGHIPGSVHVFFKSHMTENGQLKCKEEIKQNFANAGVPLDGTQIITYCGRGIAATWNLLVLDEIGIKNVVVYDGSMVEWAKDDTLPLTTL